MAKKEPPISEQRKVLRALTDLWGEGSDRGYVLIRRKGNCLAVEQLTKAHTSIKAGSLRIVG